MEGADEGDVDASQQPVVEDERGHDQLTGPPLSCCLHQHRYAKVEVRVVFAENDLVRVPFEYPKDVYPIIFLGLEIDSSLEAERPHENISESHQYRDPCGRLCKDVPREHLYVVRSGR